MKFRRLASKENGGILVITLVVSSLVGMMLACYLKMVSSQNMYTFRSQVWNSAIPLCEAGVEEALAHLNALGTNNNFGIRGWTLETNGYVRERTLDDGTYRAIIDTNFPPIITVQGRVRAPLQTAKYITRTVQVRTKWNYTFPQAILARSEIDLGGMSSLINSFISTNIPGGQYTPLYARSEAAVACLATTPGKFDLANTKIHGRIGYSAPGNVIWNAGGVGDSLWLALNTGIQVGRSVSDLNIYVPDISLPDNFGPVFAPSGRTISGVAYKYVFDSGYYRMSSFTLNNTEKALFLGNANVHVIGEMRVGGSIVIATTGDANIYCGGRVELRGQGVVNNKGYAANFAINGLNTCTEVEYGGSSKFIGTIYAPRALVKFTGGIDMVGAIVADRFDFKGGFQLHYDECIQGKAEIGRFLVASWMEL